MYKKEKMPNFARQNMSIQNPYKDVEHKVFKRTFLQETEVVVNFEPPMTSEEFSTRIVPFVNKTFNQSIPDTIDNATERAELTSNDSQVKFDFSIKSAKVVIGPAAYKSFSTSVIQYIAILVNFLRDVAHAESVADTSINKINIWPIQSKNSKLSFRGASLFIFKKEHIDDIANIKFEESDYPVSAAKEAVVNCGNSASLKAVIRVELKDAENASFMLGLKAQTSNIDVDDLMADLPKLNDIIFGAFTDIVSDNILDLMSKETL